MGRSHTRPRGATRIWIPADEALGLRMLSADRGDTPMKAIVQAQITSALERIYGADWLDQAERRMREHGTMRPMPEATATPPAIVAMAG